MSSRAARATQRNAILKTNQKKKKKSVIVIKMVDGQIIGVLFQEIYSKVLFSDHSFFTVSFEAFLVVFNFMDTSSIYMFVLIF